MSTPHRRGRHRGPTTHAVPTPAGRLALATVDEQGEAEGADMCAQLGMPTAYARHLAAAVSALPQLQHDIAYAQPVVASEAQRILDALDHPCADRANCEVDVLQNAYVQDLIVELPGVDAADIGRAALVIAAMVSAVVQHLSQDPRRQDPAAVALNLLAGAGALIYLGTTQPEPTESPA